MMTTMARKMSNKQTGQGMNKQRGGTLLGFVIGSLVGLAVALAVAVYVTKVPMPFMNKGQSRSPDQDAAEVKKNKDWNPNEPLYGKNPAKPSGAAAGPVTDVTPQSPPGVQLPKVSEDPIGDLAKAKLAAPSAGADPFTYFVQVGAFRTPEDAEQQRARMSLMGLDAKVTEREQAGRTVYRVRLGPFETRDDADKTKDRLDSSGVETAMVRVQR
jgi:cell division protein FtsN